MDTAIYLSGSVESPLRQRWRDDIRQSCNAPYEFVYPVFPDLTGDQEDQIQAFLASVKRMRSADGVIVYYEPDQPSWQPASEALIAKRTDLPVVVYWEQGRERKRGSELPGVLSYSAAATKRNHRAAIDELVSLL